MTYLLASGLVAALAIVATLTGTLVWQLRRGARSSDKLLALTEASVELQVDHDDAVAAADEADRQNRRLKDALKTAEEMVAECADVDQLPGLLDKLQKLREDVSETAHEGGHGGEAVLDPTTGTS